MSEAQEQWRRRKAQVQVQHRGKGYLRAESGLS
jgi:hypothetical protein